MVMILKTGLKGRNDVQNTLWSTENMKRPTAILFAILLSMLALASCSDSNSAAAGMSVPANPGNIYRIITLSEAGTPLEGVKVQFCSDILCITGETDANGIAVFEQNEGTGYTAHVLTVPEGYAPDETEYAVPDKYGDVSIVLKPAE